jgi:hypothetical protein
VSKYFLGFAAEHKGRDAASTVRRHHDQVALLVFGCFNYRLLGMIVALLYILGLHAGSLGEPFDNGEFFLGKLDRF